VKLAAIALLCTTAAAQTGQLPDARRTPGAATNATAAEVCSAGYTRRVRYVPNHVRLEAYAAYGRDAGGNCCELDHLIPLELGGSNDAANLWPQPLGEAAHKDRLERRLHALVCSGELELAACT
jgi:hypothetical protein